MAEYFLEDINDFMEQRRKLEEYAKKKALAWIVKNFPDCKYPKVFIRHDLETTAIVPYKKFDDGKKYFNTQFTENRHKIPMEEIFPMSP